MTLLAALDRVLSERWSAQRDGSTSHARAARCVRWLAGQRPTSARLRALVAAMREAGLGPATINRHLSALSAVLEEAGLAVEVPWQREPRGRTRRLSAGEVLTLRGACRDIRVAALIGFLAETGMRVGEAFACEVDGSWALVKDSKNGEPRKVPLTPEAARCWEQGWAGLGRSRFQHEFRKAAQLAGLQDVRPHDLRHTCASRLVDAQVSLPVVSAWLGHRDARSTLRYVHVGSEGLVEAARRMSCGSS